MRPSLAGWKPAATLDAGTANGFPLMTTAPVICFGQQPCGFFPKRFLVAKIQTARRLLAEIGGEIIFFYHDSDHDPRETKIILRHRKTDEPAQLNFAFKNRIQRKFSPLYLKHIAAGWQDKTALQLPNYVGHPLINVFKKISTAKVADFCLEMYRGMGLLEGIRVVRSSDPAVRRAACDVPEFFVDVPYEGEIVRARFNAGAPVSDPARIGSTTQKHAGSETGAPMAVDIKLTKFLPSLAEVPSKELEALKERAVKSGFDFIDFWAVDFNWHDGKPFEHHWQDYRTRKDRSLKTVSDAGFDKYPKPGKYTACVKVVDVFGCDTSITVEVKV